MPTYEYACKNCGHRFEQHQSFSDPTLTECPVCHEPALRKVFNSVGIVFKGSGFYKTDSRSDAKTASVGPSSGESGAGHHGASGGSTSGGGASTDSGSTGSGSSGSGGSSSGSGSASSGSGSGSGRSASSGSGSSGSGSTGSGS